MGYRLRSIGVQHIQKAKTESSTQDHGIFFLGDKGFRDAALPRMKKRRRPSYQHRLLRARSVVYRQECDCGSGDCGG
ncbi:hypothetical protein EJ110_NYTH40011 [Nymphaea thermarum]|nr:hypothetical protein EJ110_NYTH40011 [Nymphaea thermarum]